VPAARITGDGSQSIVTDYLGTPVQMYNAKGEKTWEADLDIYGKVRTFAGRSLSDCPFRYAGMYEDAETGLYYNRFRYYDPDSGNYLSQDPIGLAGNNPTLYGYVKDVNSWVDVLGLDCEKKVKQTTAIQKYYPDNGGALDGWKRTFLMPGDKIDRFGSIKGKYFSPEGTPMNMRALPSGNTGAYNTYRVVKPFEVEVSTIAPAFGKIGLGTQYRTPVSVEILLKRGIIVKS
jgi:RHS repeat-associated protein